jgi:uncharacterized protein (DUF2267 family)
MSATGLDVFDRTLQTTNTWLGEIMQTLGHDRRVAWHVLGSVLRALRDRLPLGLAAHLGAQLPLLVRGLYYDQWQPSEAPLKLHSLDEFLGAVSAGWRKPSPVDPADAARAVFQTLNHYVEPGQIAKIRASLPEELRQIWPESGPIAGARKSVA